MSYIGDSKTLRFTKFNMLNIISLCNLEPWSLSGNIKILTFLPDPGFAF
jgi:hypothetical protein